MNAAPSAPAPPARGSPLGASDLLVVKFGGSCLASGEGVARAAQLVCEAPARRRLVVVSAPGDTTDQLLSLVQGVQRPLDGWEVARLLSLGERASARLLVTVLRSLGVPARALEPEDPEWPLATEGGPLGASVALRETEERLGRGLARLLEESVVVVCGFLGTEAGRPTTLQRGGSDTTAVVLSRLLGCENVVLVKDVAGVYDADPRRVPGARPLPLLSAEELVGMSQGGAGVVSAEAVAWMGPGQRLRVLPFGAPLLSAQGTEVSPRDPRADPPRGRSPEPAPAPRVAAVSLLVDDWSRGMEAIRATVPQERWHGLSAVPGAATIFVDEEGLAPLLARLHASGAFRAVSVQEGLQRRSIALGGRAAHIGRGTDPFAGAFSGTLVAAARARGRLDLFLVEEPSTTLPLRPRPSGTAGVP